MGLVGVECGQVKPYMLCCQVCRLYNTIDQLVRSTKSTIEADSTQFNMYTVKWPQLAHKQR